MTTALIQRLHEPRLIVRGRLRATVRDALTGAIMQEIDVPNLVVTTGLQLICDMLAEDTLVGLNYFGIGTNNTAAAAGQTALIAEVFRGNITQQARSGPQLTVTYFLPTTAANGLMLVEAGLFTLSSGGTMFSRAIHSGINKTASVTITYQWVFSFSAS